MVRIVVMVVCLLSSAPAFGDDARSPSDNTKWWAKEFARTVTSTGGCAAMHLGVQDQLLAREALTSDHFFRLFMTEAGKILTSKKTRWLIGAIPSCFGRPCRPATAPSTYEVTLASAGGDETRRYQIHQEGCSVLPLEHINIPAAQNKGAKKPPKKEKNGGAKRSNS